MNKESIYALTIEQLIGWLEGHGHKKSRALQVWNGLYRKRVQAFSEINDVNKECIELLKENFVIQTIAEHTRQESEDGTVKFLFQLQDENVIETVLMRNKFGLSVCVTTQVGCNIGCSFCASGLLSKKRDLLTGEIIGQIMKVQSYLDDRQDGEVISHVVVMGIGEPFDNFANIVKFIEIIKEHKGLAIAGRRITVSTSGLIEQIYEFADLNLQVNLAISLHAPTNSLRSSIMKINKRFPIEQVLQAVDYYLEKTKRRVTFEYILLKGINDHREQALELADVIGTRKKMINVNLIPYNPVDEHSHYQRSTKESMEEFYDTLKKQGINCSNRLEHGTDIDAACGQLRSKQIQKTLG